MIFVSLVEDDDEIRQTFKFLINNAEGFKCISDFRDCETAIPALQKDPPDVLLMDITLPGMSGIEGVRILHDKMPNLDIIMLTVHKSDEVIFDSLCAGACGYLMKNTPPQKILDAIKEVLDGGSPMSTAIARKVITSFRVTKDSPLTKRETEVLNELCKGKSYKSIAETLFVSEDTVHFHIKNIYRKLQVHSKSEAVAKAIKQKLV